MTRSPFTPDPSKWIDTAAKPKKSLQRPLTSIRHAYATPPPTRSSPCKCSNPLASTQASGKIGKRKQKAQTSDQSTLGKYMTPPDTAPRKKGLERLKPEINKMDRASPLAKTDIGAINWSSDEYTPVAGPSRLRNDIPITPTTSNVVRAKTRKSRSRSSSCKPQSNAIDLTRSSSPSLHLASPAFTPRPQEPVQGTQAIPSSNLPHRTSSDNRSTPTPKSDSSDEVAITPVPSSVLAIHERLCGQDPKALKAVRQHWGRDDDTNTPVIERSNQKMSRSAMKRKDVDRRVKEAKRISNARGKTHSPSRKHGLVELSSDDRQSDYINVLTPLNPNISHKRSSDALKRFKTHIGIPTYPLLSAKNSPQKSKHRMKVVDTESAEVDARHQNIGNQGHEERTTPRKRKKSDTHHDITPPRSRSKRVLDDTAMIANMELGMGPPSSPTGYAKRPTKTKPSPEQLAWKPVEMDPETLITWSLGPTSAPRKSLDRNLGTEMNRLPEHPAKMGETPVGRNALHNMKNRNIPSSPPVEVQSISATEPSQSFPNLVRSSPKKSSESVHFSKHAADRWKALEAGILSVPMHPPGVETSSPAKNTRSSKAKKQGEEPSQTRLAAFGFFTNTPKRDTPQDEERIFGQAWDEEQDLDIGEVDGAGNHHAPDDLVQDIKTKEDDRSRSRLRPVPEAPYHPELWSAGIAELRKREKQQSDQALLEGHSFSDARQSNNVEHSSPKKSTPISSEMDLTSSSLSDDRGEIPTSVADWWEALGDRRSSDVQAS